MKIPHQTNISKYKMHKIISSNMFNQNKKEYQVNPFNQ